MLFFISINFCLFIINNKLYNKPFKDYFYFIHYTMITLNLDNFKKFNACGLREICSVNRDVFSNYNSLYKDDLRIYVKSKIIDNNDIIIPDMLRIVIINSSINL